MERLTFRQRRRRQSEAEVEFTEAATRQASDPDLRNTYKSLPRAPTRLIVCPMGKHINQGGILRIAEAFRLERVDFGREADRCTDMSGGTGIWSWQPYRWVDIPEAILEAKASGYRVLGLGLEEDAIALEHLAWTFPCALVLGEEMGGLPEEVRVLCDGLVAIPLFGMVGSLNVACACAIAVYSAVDAYRSSVSFSPARLASRRLVGE